MAKPSDTVTYEQVAAVLQAVSATYSHWGVSGGLSAPAHEVLQAAWTEFRGLNPALPETPKDPQD